MAANPENAFPQLVCFLTTAFLLLFFGLTGPPEFDGVVIELCDLVPLLVYFALGWLIRQLGILFALLKPW